MPPRLSFFRCLEASYLGRYASSALQTFSRSSADEGALKHISKQRSLWHSFGGTGSLPPYVLQGHTKRSLTHAGKDVGQQMAGFSGMSAPPKPPMSPVEASQDMSLYPPELIRSFAIIAHIDHGKTTLATSLMELTGAIAVGGENRQALDTLQVERERGITVKAQTVSLFYEHKGRRHLLNLIDAPGHVDFSYEVSRSLAACQGALLLVDAAQGVQAQTAANFFKAFDLDLKIIPIITKIDQGHADPEGTAAQIHAAFDLDPVTALRISAKTGQGVPQVLQRVVEDIPPPSGNPAAPLRALLFDSYYDRYRGVVCLISIVDGKMSVGDQLLMAATGHRYEALEVGILTPELRPTGVLYTGQVGYLISGMKSTRDARVGDTLFHTHAHAAAAMSASSGVAKDKPALEPLPGFQPARSMVFAGLYPTSGEEYEELQNAIDKLLCNDPSVSIQPESSEALGIGFRCGFAGMLHMDVFLQRLEQEYGTHVIATAPTVPYIVEYEDGTSSVLRNAAGLPAHGAGNQSVRIKGISEPTIVGTIIAPMSYLGALLQMCADVMGEQLEHVTLDSDRVLLKYRFPLREVVIDFYSRLKSLTSGFGSFEYEDAGYAEWKADDV
eukprot:jgi/Mesvir1/25376/Mv01418-RA.2